MNKTFLVLKEQEGPRLALEYLRKVGIAELHSLTALGDDEFLAQYADEIIAVIGALPEPERIEHYMRLRSAAIAAGNLEAAKKAAKKTVALDEADFFEILKNSTRLTGSKELTHRLGKRGNRKKLTLVVEKRLEQSLKEGNITLARGLVKTFLGRNLNLTERDALRDGLVRHGKVNELVIFMKEGSCFSTSALADAMKNALTCGSFAEYLLAAKQLQHEPEEEELLSYLMSDPAHRGCGTDEIADAINRLDYIRRGSKRKPEHRRPRP